ncbi:response regulator [Cellulomonas septica]|uniref:Response regulator transcription factor n=1 Tax=Cellulomonas septica TaxID=285080 RepID=A0ABX1K549_9CELL|nr:response regulator transcription factor [Cellulomonas septica]
MTVRLVVVDDQPTIRLGLRMILEHEDDMVVVGEAGTGDDAVCVVRATRPDVVLMDIRMPDGNGIDAVAALVADPTLHGTRTIMLTTFHDEEYVVASLRAGADGFLLKDADPAELVAAVRRVHAGDSLLDPSVTRDVVARYVRLAEAADAVRSRTASPAARQVLDRLTPRERDVLVHLATGATNADVATALALTEATVKSHVSSMLTRLGLATRVQLVVAAFDAGLVRPAGDTAADS